MFVVGWCGLALEDTVHACVEGMGLVECSDTSIQFWRCFFLPCIGSAPLVSQLSLDKNPLRCCSFHCLVKTEGARTSAAVVSPGDIGPTSSVARPVPEFSEIYVPDVKSFIPSEDVETLKPVVEDVGLSTEAKKKW